MSFTSTPTPNLSDLTGSRVLIPGGTGAVGEGVVRRFLAAGADVVVPTRTQQRADEFGALLGAAATARLHLVVHDYTTFAGAEDLVVQTIENLGGIDHVVAPIGGWWAGKHLWQIDEADWQNAFVGLASTHMAVARAALPRMAASGSYSVILGGSATWPVPQSGLVSMEQAAIRMMHQVLVAELAEGPRVYSLVLGPVSTRSVAGEAGWVTADQVGHLAVAAAAASTVGGREFSLRTAEEATTTLSSALTRIESSTAA
jgi:NAD(P)-dependent dehydrogenase (short-subunit alcohol dehydrogenase family)